MNYSKKLREIYRNKKTSQKIKEKAFGIMGVSKEEYEAIAANHLLRPDKSLVMTAYNALLQAHSIHGTVMDEIRESYKNPKNNISKKCNSCTCSKKTSGKCKSIKNLYNEEESNERMIEIGQNGEY